jgi:transcriptional regulator with XRE-family HTH domain
MSYKHPVGGRIKAMREERGWLSVENFADDTGIDVRLMRDAEANNRKQAAKLLLIARALGVTLDQITEKARGNAKWPTYSSIQICKDWELSWQMIASAKKSILIIDSFFSNEHGRLRPALSENAEMRAEPLTVSIYMTSHKREFGAQRMRELDNFGKKGKPKLSASFVKRITKGELKRYREKLYDIVGPIQLSGEGLHARVTLYEYFCLPSLRIIVVDNSHFFWSGFPPGAQNPGHVCFYMCDDGNLNLADDELRTSLIAHIDCLQRLSRKMTVQARPARSRRSTLFEEWFALLS